MRRSKYLLIFLSLLIPESLIQTNLYAHPKIEQSKKEYNKSIIKKVTQQENFIYDIPEAFERSLYTNSPNIDKSRNIRSQISEFMGVSEGNDYAGFSYPDQASNEDSISIRNLYKKIMKSQYRKRIILTKDIDSPFGL